MTRRIDPPWWWKPWLRLYPVAEWWQRPRRVRNMTEITHHDPPLPVPDGTALHAALTEAMYDHGRWERPEPPPTPEWTVTSD